MRLNIPGSPSITPRQRRLIILLLAVVAFFPTLRVGFLWDDHVMIEGNPWIRHWSWQALKRDFTTDAFEKRGDPYYRPAQTLSNRIDHTVWGLRPFGYHLTNLAAHAVNAVLVAELAVALSLPAMAALIAGALFAVHPIVIEQLLIIAGRAELFGLLFSLLAILGLLKTRPLAWAAGTLCYGIALLFKESAIITPALAALAFYARRQPPRDYLRLIPLLLVTAPYFWLRTLAVGWPGEGLSPWMTFRFFVQAFPNVLARYAALLAWPWNLHSHRMMPRLSYAWPILFAVWAGSLVWSWRRERRLLFFGLAWFTAALLPKTPVMMAGNFMLDHWAYPAGIGLYFGLAIFFTRRWEALQAGAGARAWPALLLFPLLIAWALLAHLNTALRQTDEKMYRWALRFTASNPIKFNLGLLLIETGRPREAIPFLFQVGQVYPENIENQRLLARALWLIGQRNRAIALLETVERRFPAASGLSALRQELAFMRRTLRRPAR